MALISTLGALELNFKHPDLPIGERFKKNAQDSISESKDGKKIFQIMADNFGIKDGVTHARGHASLLLDDLYILAGSISYDKKERKLIANGDVLIYKGSAVFLQTKNLVISLDKDSKIIKPFYFQDATTGMWMASDFATQVGDEYIFKNANISSCSIDSPIWHISTTSGKYDAKDAIFTLYNPTIYLGGVPVFYSPVFFLPTKNERRSGLLYPELGTSNRDGFIYVQPVFIKLGDSMDATILPQLRTLRGFGESFEFRIADKNNEVSTFHVKHFHNSDEYVKKYDLRNRDVFGLDFTLKGSNFKEGISSGFLLDVLYMNDVDYLRIDRFNEAVTEGSKLSRMNIYAKGEDNFLALYSRYFLNLNKISNDTTFQTLPSAQYHKFLDSLFFKNLVYSLDYKINRTTRRIGYGYLENAITIPVGIQFSGRNSLFTLGGYTNFFASNILIDNEKNSYIANFDVLDSKKYGNFLSATYSLEANSDLARSYGDVFHIAQLEATLSGNLASISTGLLSEQYFSQKIQDLDLNKATGQYTIDGNIYDDIWDPSNNSSFAPKYPSLKIGTNQYFYYKNQEVFNLQLGQILNLKTKSSLLDSPLEGRVSLASFYGLQLSGLFSYAHQDSSLKELSLNATYSQDYARASMLYYVKDKVDEKDGVKQESRANNLDLSFSNDFGSFGLSASANLNLNNYQEFKRTHELDGFLTSWSFGVFKNIRCFGFGLKVVNQQTLTLIKNPASKDFASSTLNNTYLKFNFSLTPVSDVDLTYRFFSANSQN